MLRFFSKDFKFTFYGIFGKKFDEKILPSLEKKSASLENNLASFSFNVANFGVLLTKVIPGFCCIFRNAKSCEARSEARKIGDTLAQNYFKLRK